MITSDYSPAAKFLHKLVLGSKLISEMSFEFEKALHFSETDIQFADDRHVFVSGLARSGTTALTRFFYESDFFASLTYSDMPFVLAPNLWQTMSSGKSNLEFRERAHQDGIFVNDQSPEAFDEVFWKVFLNDRYIQQDRLILSTIPDDILSLYDRYIKLVIKKNFKGRKLRYLSKNNNNILRFQAIQSRFLKSTIIIPFRDPLQHSLSLLNQHQHFCEIQKNDPFALNYMNWIGHHEFGLEQKPFFLNNTTLFNRLADHDKNNINFWLLTWLNYYSYILEKFSDSCILFPYESFCSDPEKMMNELFKKIDLPNFNFEFKPFSIKIRTNDEVDDRVLSDCMLVYQKLLGI